MNKYFYHCYNSDKNTVGSTVKVGPIKIMKNNSDDWIYNLLHYYYVFAVKKDATNNHRIYGMSIRPAILSISKKKRAM